jgi:hypothetical protein
MHASDAYAKYMTPESFEDSDYKHGQMQDEFMSGHTEIKECLIFTYMTLDEILSAAYFYKYDESQQAIVFDAEQEMLEFRPCLDARIPDLLSSAFMP